MLAVVSTVQIPAGNESTMEINPEQTALVIVDPQVDFLSPESVVNFGFIASEVVTTDEIVGALRAPAPTTA